MTDSLGDLLRRGADSVAVPSLDLGELVAEADRRRRRRRYLVAVTAAAAVIAIVAGSVLGVTSSRTQDPPPAGPPSPSIHKALGVEGTRPLVYAVGRTVHVGDKSVQANKPVAFIAPTDDGAVYQATLDRTLWFTDGTTTEVIGTSEWTAAPTSHRGAVTTGDSGSLVVWADTGRGRNSIPVEFVVYDTSRREEVARIPFTPPGSYRPLVLYVDEDQVYFNPEPSTSGCWAVDADDVHPCRHPQVFRFDVAAGETTKIPVSELDGALEASARVFKAATQDGRVVYGDPAFALVGNRLVASIHYSESDADAAPVTLADGSQLRLRLPTGYVPPWPADGEDSVGVSQWLDDTHVALFAGDGGGDLPAMEGDLLTCELPEGVCEVTVPGRRSPTLPRTSASQPVQDSRS